MKKYRYIGAFSLVFRSPKGEICRLLNYGDEFTAQEEIRHSLIVLI